MIKETFERSFSRVLSGHELARYCRHCETHRLNIALLEYLQVQSNAEAAPNTLLRVKLESNDTADTLPSQVLADLDAIFSD